MTAEDPGYVIYRYSERRRAVRDEMPKSSHVGLVALERTCDVRIGTRSGVDLHERA